MKEEKMMILAMLEEGKITSEEAIKLMEALEDAETFEFYEEKRQDDKSTSSQGKAHKQREFSTQDMFSTLGDIGSEIGNALSNMFDGLKDMDFSFGIRNNWDSVSSEVTYDLSDMESPSLDLRAINGSINLRPTQENLLRIKITCQYKKGTISPNEEYFDFYNEGEKIIFSPRFRNNISIKLDVFYPTKKYHEIFLDSTNGKISVEELEVSNLYCKTTNSSISVNKIKGDRVELVTKNGKIDFQYSSVNSLSGHTTNSKIFVGYSNCNDISLRTSNGKIEVAHTEADVLVCKTSNGNIDIDFITSEVIHLNTSNGRITCNGISTSKAKDIRLITTNGSITAETYNDQRSIYLDLETSMGSINLEIPSLVHKINKQVNLGLKKIVAHSPDFDDEKDHLKLLASTSNGSIKIY